MVLVMYLCKGLGLSSFQPVVFFGVFVHGFGFIEVSDRASGHAPGPGPCLQPTCHELRSGALRHLAFVVWFCLSSHFSRIPFFDPFENMNVDVYFRR